MPMPNHCIECDKPTNNYSDYSSYNVLCDKCDKKRKEEKLEIAHKVIAHSLTDMLGEEDPLSNCCAASFTYPGWPDSDFCSECHEHASIDEDDDAEAKTIGVEDGKN